jgi:hypothetical protein
MLGSKDIDDGDRQAIALALSELSYDRPGWADYLRDLARKLGVDAYYDGLREDGQQRYETPPPLPPR